MEHLSEETLGCFRHAAAKDQDFGSKLHSFCAAWATLGMRLAKAQLDAKGRFIIDFPVVRKIRVVC